MSVDEYGEINCSGVESSFLPTQFEILADTQNVSIPGHVVCIRSRGFGPEEKFYVALTGSGRKMRFTIEVRLSISNKLHETISCGRG